MSKVFQDKMHVQGGDIVRQIVMGMNDGVVSVLSILAGIVGAHQAPNVVLLTLLAATMAGAMSMGAGEFLSGKSERDYHRNEIARERVEIMLVPEFEKDEIRRIYTKKGFTGDALELAVTQVTSDPDLWVKEMVIDELGIASLEEEKLAKGILIIFGSFILGAMFPTLPYLILSRTLNSYTTFEISAGITFCGLFVVGALKKFITGAYWVKSGIEMVLVGAFAFFVTYLFGLLVGGGLG
jgi:VIT1/CCC1 family predicted Fe2+/Mn2+ transporter